MLLVTAEKVINRFRIGWKLYEFHFDYYVIDVIMSSRTLKARCAIHRLTCAELLALSSLQFTSNPSQIFSHIQYCSNSRDIAVDVIVDAERKPFRKHAIKARMDTMDSCEDLK